VVTADLRVTRGFLDPEAYDRGRPSFPADALAALAGELGLSERSTVLDLAAGTGKLTRVLVPLFDHVIAVEPSEPMLTALRRQLPGVDARVGVAEAIPVADHSVDAVLVAEAFHWFRTAEACREISRVLVPRGHLVLLWQHARWSEQAELPWVAAFDQLMEPFWETSVHLAGPHPNVTKDWKSRVAEQGMFEPFRSTEVEFVHEISGEDFVALIASWTWVAILPPKERDAALTGVRELVGDDRELALRYRTQIQWARAR